MKHFSYYNNPDLTWFRIFGYGLCFKNRKSDNFHLTFSQRNGYSRYLKTPWHVITLLKQ